MLVSLNIRNFALIEDMTVDFRGGFNVLSGETGAGKSIIIGALGMVLGEKSTQSMVRTGAESAVIEGLYDISRHRSADRFLRDAGYDTSGGEVVVRRVISAEGSSRTFINGQLANLPVLRELGALLVDIHGQHEHQSLLRVSLHLELLDSFAGMQEDAARLGELRRAVIRTGEQLAALELDEQEKQRRLELNNFAVEEIDGAQLRENEESELEEEARMLNNFEKIYAALESARQNLHSSAALGHVQKAAAALEGVSEHDQRVAKLQAAVSDAAYALEDLNDQLRSIYAGMEFDPARQEEVNRRLAVIQDLKRKYGSTVAEVIAYRERCAAENESISSVEERRTTLSAELNQLQEQASQEAFSLSKRRQQAGRELEKRIMEELTFLGMEKTVFKVDFRYVKDPAGFIRANGEQIKLFDSGIDYVEFMIAPNPGEAPRPLRRIASGGEISRVMLALKTVLQREGSCDTLVFDEVDAGIGGVTASAVGQKLQQVSRRWQVLCITHLPQIAALADHHLMVAKSVEEGRTRTTVRTLGSEERLQELARMIGGQTVTEATLVQARQMIEQGQNRR